MNFIALNKLQKDKLTDEGFTWLEKRKQELFDAAVDRCLDETGFNAVEWLREEEKEEYKKILNLLGE